MFKRVAISFVCVFFAVSLIAQESDGGNATTASGITLLEYVEQYAAVSDKVSDVVSTIEDIETELNAAKVRRESALRIEEIAVELEAARMSKREISNQEIMSAVETFLAYVQAERDHRLALYSSDISEQEYKRMQGRFSSGIITEKELKTSSISLLQAEKSIAAALRSLTQSRAKLTRPLDLDSDTKFDTEIEWKSFDTDSLTLDAKIVRQNSYEFFKADNLQRIKEKTALAKSDKTIYTKEEIETAQSELADAEDTLDTAIWSIEDQVTEMRYQITSAVTDRRIQQNNFALRKLDLEELELKFSYGEVYQSDVDSARRALREAEDALLQSEEILQKLYLDWTNLSGGECMEALTSMIN